MEDYRAWAESVLQKVREKMEWVSEKNRDKILMWGIIVTAEPAALESVFRPPARFFFLFTE